MHGTSAGMNECDYRYFFNIIVKLYSVPCALVVYRLLYSNSDAVALSPDVVPSVSGLS